MLHPRCTRFTQNVERKSNKERVEWFAWNVFLLHSWRVEGNEKALNNDHPPPRDIRGAWGLEKAHLRDKERGGGWKRRKKPSEWGWERGKREKTEVWVVGSGRKKGLKWRGEVGRFLWNRIHPFPVTHGWGWVGCWVSDSPTRGGRGPLCMMYALHLEPDFVHKSHSMDYRIEALRRGFNASKRTRHVQKDTRHINHL